MYVRTFGSTRLTDFGGLVTQIHKHDLPPQLSGDCLNVEFTPGSVKSRAGSGVALNPSNSYNWNGIHQFVNRDNSRLLMGLQSSGTLWKESPQGTLASVATGYGTGLVMKADTLFGREFICLSDGKFGVVHPLQYDGTNLDRVSMTAPGQSSYTTVTEYNIPGLVTAGRHFVAVLYKNRNGGISPLAHMGYVDSAGSKRIQITNLPIGPTGTASRIIVMTAANDPTFYTLAEGTPNGLTIQDNTTTTVYINVADSSLLLGKNMSEYCYRVGLPPQAGVVPYNNRLVYWGGLNNLADHGFPPVNATSTPPPVAVPDTWPNLTFDAGNSQYGTPMSWGPWQGHITGALATPAGCTGACLRLTGNGSDAWVAMMNEVDLTYGATFDKGKKYNARARLKRSAGATGAGGYVYFMFSQYGGSGIVSISSLTTEFAVYDIATNVDPSTLVFDKCVIGVSGPLENNEYVDVDYIEIYPSNKPYNLSTLAISNVYDPEAYDGRTGFISISDNDGQAVRSCFVIGGTLYVAKEHSLYAVFDNYATEPSGWSIQKRSDFVGTPSLNGVGVGEGWAVILAKSGMYYFDGGMPQKISQEIQPTWDAINWQYAYKSWVVVNPEQKQIYVGVPTGANTEVNTMYMLDYTDGFGDPLAKPGRGRKWVPWDLYGGCAAMVYRDSLAREFFIGTNNSSGKILRLDSTLTDDSGSGTAVAVHSYWESGMIPDIPGMHLYAGTIFGGNGVGAVDVSYTMQNGVNTAVYSVPILDPPERDLQCPFAHGTTGSRIAVRFGANTVGNWWKVDKVSVYHKPHPALYIRSDT